MKQCYYCGITLTPGKSKGKALPTTNTKDHLIPVSRYAQFGLKKGVKGNAVRACLKDNQEKGMLTADEYKVVLAFRMGRIPKPDNKIFFGEANRPAENSDKPD